MQKLVPTTNPRRLTATPHLWRCLSPPASSDGRSGSAHCAAIAMAERMRGEAYRINPAGYLDHVFVFGEQHLRHRGGRSDPTEQTAQTCSDAPLFEFAVGLVTKRDAAYIKVIVGA